MNGGSRFNLLSLTWSPVKSDCGYDGWQPGNISRAPLTAVLIDRREKKAFAYIISRLSSAIIKINQ